VQNYIFRKTPVENLIESLWKCKFDSFMHICILLFTVILEFYQKHSIRSNLVRCNIY